MSKHSKWAKIKRQKGVTDVKKGTMTTKLANAIALAARSGDDPESNFKLRLAIDKAREQNIPKDTILRAIARGAGTLEGQVIEEVLYECFGPGGIAVMIEVATDKKNRTLQAIKKLLQDHGGRLGGQSSVAWLFERKGVVTIPKAHFRDDLELALIDAGADTIEMNDVVTITTPPEKLDAVRRAGEQGAVPPNDVALEWLPKEHLHVPDNAKEKIKNFFEELDALDDVQEWYANVDIETL